MPISPPAAPAPARAVLAVTVVFCLLVSAAAAAERDSAAASALAYGWLTAQVTSSGLVDSYQDNKPVCYTYDQALAAIAFVAKGDTAAAQRILDALREMQNEDGSWYSAYHCEKKSREERRRFVGPVLWVTLAAAHYEKRTGDGRYRPMAKAALDWALQFQQKDGGINAGLNGLGFPEHWASTEHNLDAYAALNFFGYNRERRRVRRFLDHVAWDSVHHRFMEGRDNPGAPLDVNAWGVLALGPEGEHSYRRALDYSLRNHRVEKKRGWLFGPTVDGFDLDTHRRDVWLEGTGQMVAALRMAGRREEADYFLHEIIRAQDSDGGVPYALRGHSNGYSRMSNRQSVAGTTWLIFAAQGFNPLQP